MHTTEKCFILLAYLRYSYYRGILLDIYTLLPSLVVRTGVLRTVCKDTTGQGTALRSVRSLATAEAGPETPQWIDPWSIWLHTVTQNKDLFFIWHPPPLSRYTQIMYYFIILWHYLRHKNAYIHVGYDHCIRSSSLCTL